MRDTMTLRIIIAIPIMQLFLFGYAINSDPKHLPAGLLSIEDFEIHPHDRRGARTIPATTISDPPAARPRRRPASRAAI